MNEDGFVAYIELYLRAVRQADADVVIADRSLFDLYLYNHGSLHGYKSYIDMLRELVFVEAKTVNFYVYLPVEFPLTGDEIRPSDTAYQAQIDRNAVHLMKYFGMRTVVASGNLSERVETVVQQLQHG